MSELTRLTGGDTSKTGNGLANGVLEIENINIQESPTEVKSTVVDFNKPTESVLNFTSISTPTERKPADLSNLPKEKLEGVDVRLSKEDDIFKEGGPFDQYRAQKICEMEEVNSIIDSHNAKVAAMRGEDIPTDEELKKIGTEDMSAALKGTVFHNQSGYVDYIEEQKKFQEEKNQEVTSDLDQLLSGDSDDLDIIEEDFMNSEETKVVPSSIDELETEQSDVIFDMEEEDNELDMDEQMAAMEEYDSDDDAVEVEEVEEEVVEESNTPEDLEEAEAKINERVKVRTIKDEVNLDFDDTEEEDKDEATKANLKELQLDAQKKIRPFSKTVDFNVFKKTNTPVALSKGIFEVSKQAAFDWVLPTTGIKIAMSKFKADEIETLSNTEGQTDFSSQKELYKLFYTHIVSPKPKKFEEWLKTISFSDDDHLYFTAFGASFGGSLYMPYDCSKCNKTYLSEKLAFKDLYKIEDKKEEAKIKELLNDEYSKPKKLYRSELVQISDSFIFEFRDPSIYNVIFETSLLSDDFKEKYSDTINLISYIESIEMIDWVNQSRNPLKIATDPNHIAVGVKSKIIEYSKVIRSLTSDQKGLLISYLSTIGNKTPKIEYQRPASTCVHCGNEISETAMRAQTMLFTRAQLGVLIHTSLN